MADGKRRSKGKGFASLKEAVEYLYKKLNAKDFKHWVYEDERGRQDYAVCRFNLETDKTYRPFHLDESARRWQIGDPPRPVPLSPDRVEEGGACLRPRGGKCVDKARSLGLTATTSDHGAGSARKTDWTPLAGKEVIGVPDHDSAGEGYAKEVMRLLAEVEPRPTVKIVRLPLKEDGDDIEQWLSEVLPDSWNDQQCRAELERLVDEAPLEALTADESPIDAPRSGELHEPTAGKSVRVHARYPRPGGYTVILRNLRILRTTDRRAGMAFRRTRGRGSRPMIGGTLVRLNLFVKQNPRYISFLPQGDEPTKSISNKLGSSGSCAPLFEDRQRRRLVGWRSTHRGRDQRPQFPPPDPHPLPSSLFRRTDQLPSGWVWRAKTG